MGPRTALRVSAVVGPTLLVAAVGAFALAAVRRADRAEATAVSTFSTTVALGRTVGLLPGQERASASPLVDRQIAALRVLMAGDSVPQRALDTLTARVAAARGAADSATATRAMGDVRSATAVIVDEAQRVAAAQLVLARRAHAFVAITLACGTLLAIVLALLINGALAKAAREHEEQSHEAQSMARRVEATNRELHAAAVEADEAREARAAERRFLRRVIDINPNFVFAKDRQGRFTLVNQALADAYATTIDNLIGKSDADFNTNDTEVEFFRRVDQQVIDSGKPLLIPEEQITDASGSVRWLQTVKVPLVGETGRAEQVLGVSTDITDRKRMEVALRAEGVRVRAMQRVTAALAAALTPHDVAMVVASEGAAVVGSQAAAVGVMIADGSEFELLAMTGVDDEVIRQWQRFPNTPGLPYPDVVASGEPIFITNREDYIARFPALREVLANNPLCAAAILPLIIEGRPQGAMSFDFTAPREFDEGDRALLTTLCRQCSQALERARLYVTERAARSGAEDANQAKSTFLATMSHELRTPLNAIGGYVEILELGIRGPVSEAQREDLGRIRSAAQYLLGLINDVLNFVQLESAAVRFAPQEFHVDAALRGAAGLIELQARAKSLGFTTAPCDPAVTAHADPDKVQQVILNLLSNAVKFTPPGGTVTLMCVPLGAPSDSVEITVHDTGPGIPHDKLDQIFEPFVQIGRDLRNPSSGVGLGLAISRELARGMGGELTAKSEPGVGSTFTLRLPAAPPSRPTVAPRAGETAHIPA